MRQLVEAGRGQAPARLPGTGAWGQGHGVQAPSGLRLDGSQTARRRGCLQAGAQREVLRLRGVVHGRVLLRLRRLFACGAALVTRNPETGSFTGIKDALHVSEWYPRDIASASTGRDAPQFKWAWGCVLLIVWQSTQRVESHTVCCSRLLW